MRDRLSDIRCDPSLVIADALRSASDTPCPTPTHIVASAFLPPRFSQPVRRGHREPRARHAERMAERDRAAIRIDVLGIVGKAELAQHGQRLRGEGLVEFDHVEVADLQAEPRHQLAASTAPGRCP